MTYSSSASRASLASGMTDMLIMSPPHCRYMRDSARVENAGPIASVSPNSQYFRLRTLHANYSFPSVQDNIPRFLQDFFHSGGHESIQLLAEWFTEHGVDDQSFSSKEGILPDTLSSVDDLIGNDEMTRCNLLSQRADRREGNDSLTTDMLQGGDVCSGRNLTGGDGVMVTVTGNEGNEGTRWQRGDSYRRGRFAPGSLNMKGLADKLCISYYPRVTWQASLHKGEVVKMVETTATDTSDKDCERLISARL